MLVESIILIDTIRVNTLSVTGPESLNRSDASEVSSELSGIRGAAGSKIGGRGGIVRESRCDRLERPRLEG